MFICRMCGSYNFRVWIVKYIYYQPAEFLCLLGVIIFLMYLDVFIKNLPVKLSRNTWYICAFNIVCNRRAIFNPIWLSRILPERCLFVNCISRALPDLHNSSTILWQFQVNITDKIRRKTYHIAIDMVQNQDYLITQGFVSWFYVNSRHLKSVKVYQKTQHFYAQQNVLVIFCSNCLRLLVF